MAAPSRRAQDLLMDDKWDLCVDLSLRRVVYSSLAGAATGLSLPRVAGRLSPSALAAALVPPTPTALAFWRMLKSFPLRILLSFPSFHPSPSVNTSPFLRRAGSPTSRWAALAFGAGCGVGSAYTDCSRILDGHVPRFSAPLAAKAASAAPAPAAPAVFAPPPVAPAPAPVPSAAAAAAGASGSSDQLPQNCLHRLRCILGGQMLHFPPSPPLSLAVARAAPSSPAVPCHPCHPCHPFCPCCAAADPADSAPAFGSVCAPFQ
ncbi:unnamed protein product [Closterium sp. Naga37s-1]|nr:unnamed protein product [Closterium sp. Naga37s-1]